jgi:hypothetical protein
VAGPASVEPSRWVPTYGWWCHPRDYSLTVIVSPSHAAVEEDAEFDVTLRGYAGGPAVLWEHRLGRLRQGDERAIALDDLALPEPPDSGGILEVHTIRLDSEPKKGVGVLGMWIDGRGHHGGGYIIPTVAIRGARKIVRRDDLQVIPGIMLTEDVDTDLVLLNVLDSPVDIELVACSAGGLRSEPGKLSIGPRSAWRGPLEKNVPRVRRLLGQDGGIGSLAIYSSHRILPYFSLRRAGGPATSLDHSAPMFA